MPATVTFTPDASSTYDTAIGNGVDATGSAHLPLKSGARRLYVANGGSDASATPTNPATPLATPAGARALISQGTFEPYQVCLARGSSWAEGLPNLNERGGFSALYPAVWQDYDPADPTNESLMGRATTNRPIVNTGGNAQSLVNGAWDTRYLAIRGLDWGQSNVIDQTVGFVGGIGYFLFENNVVRYGTVATQTLGFGQQTKRIFRKNSFYGSFATDDFAGSSIYMDGCDACTVEDNISWHPGWKIGASRDATNVNGGATINRHCIYLHEDSDAVVRRNICVDPSATGASVRGPVTAYDNLFLDCPISIIAGLGTNYPTIRPDGVDLQIYNNTILGDADIETANPRGTAIQTGNGILGSRAHHNLIVRSRNPAGTNVYRFATEAGAALPSHCAYEDNLSHLWGPDHLGGGAFSAYNFPTYARNTDGASGPNMYADSGALAVAMGYADKAAWMAHLIAHPEDAGTQALAAKAIMGAGYGMTWA